MDLLNTTIATGLKAHAAAGGNSCTYRRGATEITVTVVWGVTQIEELTDPTGTVADFSDAIIEDYAGLTTTFGEPQRGDQIEDSDGVIREARPLDDEHVYDWVGSKRQALRIHTVYVDDA